MRPIMAVVAVVLALGCAAGAFAQNPGATIVFNVDGMLLYEGTGEMMMPCAPNMPITVGNLRLTEVRLPSDAIFGFTGLIMPQRGAIDERLVVLDNSWDSPQGLALLCEVIDPMMPIGFRLRTDSYRRGDNSTWLGLMLSPGHNRVGEMRPVEQSRRFTSDPTWYVQADAGVADDASRFSIELDVGGHGSFSIKQIEIKAWPTRPTVMQ